MFFILDSVGYMSIPRNGNFSKFPVLGNEEKTHIRRTKLTHNGSLRQLLASSIKCLKYVTMIYVAFSQLQLLHCKKALPMLLLWSFMGTVA